MTTAAAASSQSTTTTPAVGSNKSPPPSGNQPRNKHNNNKTSSASTSTSSSSTPRVKRYAKKNSGGTATTTPNPRKQPSAASQWSSQLDRPYIWAFVLLLTVYTIVTILTYEKLSRADNHPHAKSSSNGGDSAVVVVDADGSGEASGAADAAGDTAASSNNNKKTIDYLQHHSFPLHATQQDSEWISHPGLDLVKDPKKIPKGLPRKILVPQFWADAYAQYYNQSFSSVREYLGESGQKLMTQQEAASIGSYTSMATTTNSKDDNNNEASGQLETIYLSIASYRDPECTLTVHDLYSRAKHPERIRVAIIDQSVPGVDVPCLTPPEPDFKSCQDDPQQPLCRYRHLMDYYHLDAQLAVGPVFARHLAHRLYRGEYFAMQLDSHCRFIQHWDDNLVQQWKSAKNEYAVLSTYLSDIHNRIDPNTYAPLSKLRPIMCKSDYEGVGDLRHLRHGQQPEGVPGIHGQPTLHPFWAAGFSFARGHFVVQVPYDQYLPMVFQGEEISLGLRGFTYGYDYYTPEQGVCFHIYAIKDNKQKRKGIHMFWENSNIYSGTGMVAMKRLNSIIGMVKGGKAYPAKEWVQADKEKYGLGAVRTTDKFFRTFGIHTHNQTVEQNLCTFVGKPMMAKFLPALRSNGMGIDYDHIDYEFRDPNPKPPQTNVNKPKPKPVEPVFTAKHNKKKDEQKPNDPLLQKQQKIPELPIKLQLEQQKQKQKQ